MGRGKHRKPALGLDRLEGRELLSGLLVALTNNVG